MDIISISGLDGSGKSTQIELLQKHLESQGKKVKYFHAVQFSLPQAAKAFFKKHCLICKLVGKCKVTPVPGGTKSPIGDLVPSAQPGVTNANWLQIKLRKLALHIDLIRFKSYLKKLEKQGYDFLVSDRYFYDNIINISFLEKKYEIRNTKYEIRKPDHAFYLKTDPETIMLRDRVPEQGLEYLEAKKQLFDEFAPIFDLKIIDGNRNKEEIFEEIKNVISK